MTFLRSIDEPSWRLNSNSQRETDSRSDRKKIAQKKKLRKKNNEYVIN